MQIMKTCCQSHAVAAGKYRKVPAEGVRASYPYRVCAELIQVVDVAGSDSLVHVR